MGAPQPAPQSGRCPACAFWAQPLLCYPQINGTFFFVFLSSPAVLSAGQIHVEGSPPAPSPPPVHPHHDGILHRPVPCVGPQASPHRRAGGLCTGSPGGLLRGEYGKPGKKPKKPAVGMLCGGPGGIAATSLKRTAYSAKK